MCINDCYARIILRIDSRSELVHTQFYYHRSARRQALLYTITEVLKGSQSQSCAYGGRLLRFHDLSQAAVLIARIPKHVGVESDVFVRLYLLLHHGGRVFYRIIEILQPRAHF